jgi:hypothetical protein
MILHAALVPLFLLAAVPAAAEPTCRPAVVAETAPETIRLANGDVFLPDDPSDALEISPGDIVFACEDHLFEIESLFPISGRWANHEM